MRRLVTAAALFALAFSTAQAQSSNIQLDIDHASFKYDDSTTLLEMYLAFEAVSLPFAPDSVGFSVSLPLDMSIIAASTADLPGAEDEAVWADVADLAFVIADTSALLPSQQFVHQVRAAVPPGEYQMRITLPSFNGEPQLSLRRDVVVPDFSDSQLAELSDVALAASISRADDRNDPFYKNGLIVRPNANQLFGGSLSRVFYYAEAYNLDQALPPGSEYTVLSYIAEANVPQPLEGLQKRATRQARPVDVLVGWLDVSEVPSGSYFLRVALLDENNEALVERSRKFFVYNPHVQRESPVVAMEEAFETSQYASMTEEEVDQSYEHIEIIAAESERRRMRGIQDLDERRRYLMEFWRKRDPNLSTTVNEFQEEFYGRLQYANDRYSSSFDEGWATDRGRALIKYGNPSAVEPHLFDRGFKPYEVWNYNNIPGEGQAQFIFADVDGFGDWELLHSTVAGERKVANWIEEVREKTGGF